MGDHADDKGWPTESPLAADDQDSGTGSQGNESGRKRTKIRGASGETADYSKAGNGSRTPWASEGKAK